MVENTHSEEKKDQNSDNKKTTIVPISMDTDALNYLKEQGISRSEFFRQAFLKFKKGELIYDRSLQR